MQAEVSGNLEESRKDGEESVSKHFKHTLGGSALYTVSPLTGMLCTWVSHL